MTPQWSGRGGRGEDLVSTVWRKSRRSGSSGSCVETALRSGTVGVRDSKDPHGPALAFAVPAWKAFVGTLRNLPVE